MTIIDDRRAPRALTTPPAADVTPASPVHVYKDSDGNASVDTPFAAVTYLEHDCLGERIEGWPAVQLGDVLGNEADLREHIAACQALLDHVDPGGVNRLPEPRKPEPQPVQAEQAQHATGDPAVRAAVALDAHHVLVLRALADHAYAGYDGTDHLWDDGCGGKVAWTCEDHDAAAALGEAGLLVGFLPTALGCRVAEFLDQVAAVKRAVA